MNKEIKKAIILNIFLILIGLFLISFVSAWSNNTFNNSLTIENLTFDGSETIVDTNTMDNYSDGNPYNNGNAGFCLTGCTYTGVGENITLDKKSIKKAGFYLIKTGSPTGNINISIRHQNGSIIENKLLTNAENISASGGYYEATFNNNQSLSGSYYFMLQIINGTSNLTNYPKMLFVTSGYTIYGTASGNILTYGNSFSYNGSFLDTGNPDALIKLTYSNINRYLSIPSSVSALTNAKLNLSGYIVANYSQELENDTEYWVNWTLEEVSVLNPSQAYDENWGSMADGDSLTTTALKSWLLDENFSKPTGYNIAKANLTFKYNIGASSGSGLINMGVYCYNGVSYDTLYSETYGNSGLSGITTRDIEMTSACYNRTTVDIRYSFSGRGNGVTASSFNLYETNITYVNGTFSTNPSLSIGSTNVWNYSGSFSQLNNQTSNFASAINSYLGTCTFVGGYCNVPFIFSSESAGILQDSALDFSDTGILSNGVSYNASTYETATESFTFNFTVGSSVSSSASLIYNGSTYSSAVFCNNNDCIASNTLDIPLISGTSQNNSFYWSVTTNDGVSSTITNSSLYYQNVDYINLQLCNGTYTQKALNFTMVDETTGIILNASSTPVTYLTTFKYWKGSGSVYKNYSYSLVNSTSANSFQFCLFPNSTILKIDMDTQYGAYTYADRAYAFRNYTITNATQNIALYNLLSADATKFNVNLKQGTEFIEGAIVDVLKYFTGEGVYKKVMIGVTDDNGQFVANLKIDQQYKFIPTVDVTTYDAIIKQSACSSTPCEINLNIGDIAVDSFTDFYNYFAQNVNYNLTYNGTLKTVNLSFIDLTGTANYWRLWVYLPNASSDTVITVCDLKSYSSVGTLGCDYTNYTGDLVAKVYISRSPEKLVEFINFVNSNDSSVLGASAIMASIIIILVVFFTGVRNPVVALVLLPFALIVLKLIHFLPLDWSWIIGITVFDLWIIKRLNV